MNGQSGAELIAAERQRQIEDERYSLEHDDTLNAGELTAAGIAYAIETLPPDPMRKDDTAFWDWWPWGRSWWKPTGDRVRDLTKAGALLAAEIDRELRARAELAAAAEATDVTEPAP